MNDKDKSYFIKLILVPIIFVSFMVVFGLMVKNKRVINPQPQVSVSPEPTITPVFKNETVNWKTYRNAEYGFEVKYPPAWSYNDGPLPYTFYFGNSGPYEYQVGIWVTPASNINKTDEQCIATILAGKPGWRCEGEQWSDTEHGVKTGYMVKHIYIEVENNYKFYYFSVAASEQNITNRFNFFNQMLSTFKFIGNNETADWKTYTNDQYGFEIKYPDSWNLGKESSKTGESYKVDFVSSDTIKNNIKKVVTVSVFENSKNYLVDKWLKEQHDDPDNVNNVGLIFEKEFLVSGEKGLKGGFGCCGGYREAFFVAKGNYAYAVQGGYMDFDVKPLGSLYDYSEDFDQILSTFKFTEKNKNADWQAYKNEQYRFEFKYPNIYKFTAPPDELIEYQKSRGITYLAYFFRPGINASISVLFENINFNLQDIKQRFAPTGNENLPEQVAAGQNIFYFYGAGGGGVAYPDNYFYNLNGKVLIISFDGPYIDDKTPSDETKQLEFQIISIFKFINQ